ncbi:acyl-CoA/acyl-ACP dehydrogenase [Bacillus methanolicus]|uniref:Putative acyl-CoA dehydrogenase n=1 Tax=Bacillus methanolicus (strain MGA3 / ATCC 53907) TaxID=796606 RepID=I3E8M6_BACMM|nr:acyl-CoA/acyl-ACP dehydrogenase [Bacillus methanolicus]AIE60116.1 putative acyl-CoA dehydrogenase [Bacillus methanolicus MGA3]EIJ82847.1 acyl-CoA dehydrogenase domain protein [Bacillus methanolicus MGA3]
MAIKELKEIKVLEDLIVNQLKSFVRKIDCEAYYPRDFLTALGKFGLLRSQGLPESEILFREVRLVEEIAKVCMTTAFNLWCHLASLTYIRKSDNLFLKNEILPLLENGQLLGGTGLSNPMKYYAGIESLHLKAKRSAGGYNVSGQLPSVSNLGQDHWFGIIASVNEEERIMAFVPCHAKGLKLKEKLEYLGVNGSATYACSFHDVFIPDDWIIAQQADEFVAKIRPVFVLYQIPLGLGVTEASIQSIEKICNKQGGCNQFLSIQPDELLNELKPLREKVYQLSESSDLTKHWKDLLQVRLDVVHLTLKAVQAGMLHHGGAGYIQKSDPSRRLRESYFLANLTPTVKHLEKMIQSFIPVN